MSNILIMVSLYVKGKDLIPDDVTRSLDVFPTRSQVKGEHRTTPSGASYTKKNGSWVFEVESNSENLDDHLDILFESINFDKDKLKDVGGVEEVFLDIFITKNVDTDGYASFNFTINPNRIEKLNKWNIPVEFTIAAGRE